MSPFTLFLCLSLEKKKKNLQFRPFHTASFYKSQVFFGVELCFPLGRCFPAEKRKQQAGLSLGSLPDHQEIPGPWRSVSLKLNSPKIKRRPQGTSMSPKSPGPVPQSQWFVAINRVKPLPYGALCLSSQMSNGYEGRKPKVSFHLEHA